MTSLIWITVKEILAFRWKPGRDVVVVIISWFLVTATLYTASVIVGPQAGGGLPYFFLYAVLTATLFGVGIPLYWMVVVRGRPLADLGISARWLGLSVVLQLVFAALQYMGTLARVQLPSLDQLVLLIGLSLAIGFFEAVFWRGWVLLRQEVAWDDHAVEPRWIGLAPWGTTSGPPAPGSQHAAVSAEPPARGWCLPHPRRLPAPAAPAAARR